VGGDNEREGDDGSDDDEVKEQMKEEINKSFVSEILLWLLLLFLTWVGCDLYQQ
jgi:hypothetical protein